MREPVGISAHSRLSLVCCQARSNTFLSEIENTPAYFSRQAVTIV